MVRFLSNRFGFTLMRSESERARHEKRNSIEWGQWSIAAKCNRLCFGQNGKIYTNARIELFFARCDRFKISRKVEMPSQELVKNLWIWPRSALLAWFGLTNLKLTKTEKAKSFLQGGFFDR